MVQVKKAAYRATALTRQLLAFSRMQVLQPQVLDLNAVIAHVNRMMPVLLGEEIEYKFLPEERLAHIKANPSRFGRLIEMAPAWVRNANQISCFYSVQAPNRTVQRLRLHG